MKTPSARGKLQPIALAAEQLRIQLSLQISNLSAYRRVGEEQFVGCAPHMTQSSHRFESPECI